MGVLTVVLSGIGRQAAFWGALAAAVIAALWIAVRRGRRDAQADYAIRRAQARITALKTARDIHHELQDADRDDLQRRTDRWMRD